VIHISIWGIEVFSGVLSGDGIEFWVPCDSVYPHLGVWNSADTALAVTYSNANSSHILQYPGLYSRCAAHIQSSWWWRDFSQIVRSRENYMKRI